MAGISSNTIVSDQVRRNRTRERRIAFHLTVAVAATYLLTHSGYVNGPDGAIMVRQARSFGSGHLWIEPLEAWPDHFVRIVRDPVDGVHHYPWFAPGLPLLAVPAWLLGERLASLAPESERRLFDVDARRQRLEPGFRFRVSYYPSAAADFDSAFATFVASWTTAVLSALAVLFVFRVGRQTGFAIPTSLTLATLTAFATPMWHYGREFFSEPVAALGLIGFLSFAIDARERSSPWLWAAAGSFLGLAVLARVAHVVLLLPAAGLVVSSLRGERFRPAVRAGLAFGAPLAVVLLGLLAYNLARFGDPLETGYGRFASAWTTPFTEGLIGLLASPGRGLLVYCPLLLVAFISLPRFGRRAPNEAGFTVAAAATLLLFYSRWFMWEGGWCWGPRFLLPLVPLLVLPLAAALEAWPRTSRLARICIVSICGLSLAIAASGVLVNFVDFHVWLRARFEQHSAVFQAAGVRSYYDLLRWDWRFFPPLYALRLPSQSFVLPLALASPGLTLGCMLAFAAALLWSLRGLWYELRGDPLGIGRREGSKHAKLPCDQRP